MNLNLKHAVCLALTVYATATLASRAEQVILGFDSGELKRCAFTNMTECTLLSEQPSPVSSMAVASEFIYLGLQSGELTRCALFHPSNCSTFHQMDSEINSVIVFKKNVYLANAEGVFKCGLRKSEECELFYQSHSPIYSLETHESYIYAGTEGATLIRCSLDVAGNCTEVANTTSAVNAMAVSENKLYLALKDGSVQFCEFSNITDCFTLFEAHTEIKDIDIFEGNVQVSLRSGELMRYDFESDRVESALCNLSSPILSLFTVYATTPVKRHYVGESQDCTWQFTACPPFIVYYDVESRAAMELYVKDNKLYNSKNELFDTSRSGFSHSGTRAIFVMDSAGRLFASNQHPIGLLHHSSLMAGMPVASAGELKVTEGVIKSVSSCSGHYRPTLELTKQITSSLKRKGYDRSFSVLECGRGTKLFIDLNYKKTDLYYKAKHEFYSRKVKHLN